MIHVHCVNDTFGYRYESARRGERPPHITQWEKLLEICQGIYLVESTVDTRACLPCDANPYLLTCPCYSGRHKGICSHIIASTHIIMRDHYPMDRQVQFNALYLLKKLCASRGAGAPRKPRGGLVVEDSSDEEAAELEQTANDW